MTGNFLKCLEIEYFRGFFDRQTIDFAMPSEQKRGSGLTVIVGPNNTGKTSIIEALLIDTARSLKDYERHRNQPPKITIKLSIEDTENVYTFEGEDGCRIIKKNEKMPVDIELIGSGRSWGSHAEHNTRAPNDFVKNSKQGGARSASGNEVLQSIIGCNERQRNRITELMQEFIPNFSNWVIDENDQGKYIRYGKEDHTHSSRFLGSGVLSLFRIFLHFTDENPNKKILIIDEPELSLHPTAQKALAKHLSEFSKNNQVIICTHSPYFINWDDIENGASIIRLNKKEEKCLVSCLTPELSKEIVNLTSDWMKPQFMDIVAKEIFFADKVLFVEGQEDVALIKKWFKYNDKPISFDVFGYGVGGRGNFSIFLEIAKNLGLKKVAALYDGDEDAKVNYEEDKKIYEQEEKKKVFGFFQLSTWDIREKEEKTGIFDRSGKIKPEAEKDFEELMEKIIKFFSISPNEVSDSSHAVNLAESPADELVLAEGFSV